MELFSTNKLFKEEKYEEILALWRNDESRNRMTDWDKWYVLLSLNKQKRYQETLDAYKLLRAKRDESTETELWQRIEDTVCRALYYAHVKTFDFRQGDSSKLFKQVDYILAHSSDSPYSVKGKAALFVVDAAEEGKLAVENASELIIRYLDAVNPSTLGREEFEYIDQQGNRRAKAPDREIWYAARAKALLKLQRYGECMACWNGCIVLNKSDLPPVLTESNLQDAADDKPILTVSASVPDSLQPLKSYLASQAAVSDQLTLTQPRHIAAARRAVAALHQAEDTLRSYSVDLAGVDLQQAQMALAEITGDEVEEKLLDEVFGRFCVGK